MELKIESLSVRYPGLPTPALSIASLAIASGGHVALTGGSGSGKSTLINALTGLERVREGRLSWDGQDISTLSERDRDRWRGINIGLVMQEFHLFPGLSVLDNILLPARLSRAHSAGLTQRARELLDQVGLKRPQQHVETLSRGEMQRTAIARALLRQPKIIIADEPTASLDEESGAAVGDLLTSIARETGSTLIIATHDPRLMQRLDIRLTLKAGRLVQDQQHAEATP